MQNFKNKTPKRFRLFFLFYKSILSSQYPQNDATIQNINQASRNVDIGMHDLILEKWNYRISRKAGSSNLKWPV